MADLGLLAAVLFAYGLLSRRLDSLAVTAPMVFVGAGIVLGPGVLGLTRIELTGETGLLVAEIALVIVLFADAARLDLRVLRGDSNLPARLLGVGMPLTIGLGVLSGALLLERIELWEAAIIAAVLAPTDAALGQVVVSSPGVPQRVRQALNVESGLNDGLSIPFLFLFVGLAVAGAEVTATGWVAFAGAQIGFGAGVGALVGLVGGALYRRAVETKMMTGTFEQLAMVALAVGTWALAESVGGNGFIGAFVAGLVTGRIVPSCGEQILDFVLDEGQLITLSVFFIFGASAIGFLEAADWTVLIYGFASLTVVRMLPVAIALIGTGLRVSTVSFLAWFGPRGLASIILALVVVEEEPDLPALDVVLAAMTVTVLASIVLHGLTARPLVRAYTRRIEAQPGAGAERETVLDLPIRGRASTST
ncbi:MAG: cation:proton antiporter [Solirubrobacterales bacterium]|nr:cation:proton antiporter [Solirubrobacterales bacterium]